jgi:hypothetical protein
VSDIEDVLKVYPAINPFLKQIEPWIGAYRDSRLSFVALLQEGEFVLIAARLRLQSPSYVALKDSISTPHLRVAEVPFAASSGRLVDFVGTLLTGRLFPAGEQLVKFANSSNAAYTAYHEHPPDLGIAAPVPYLDALRLCGARKWDLLQNRHLEIERELTPHGYHSLDEVVSDWGLGHPNTDATMVEFIAEPVVQLMPSCAVRNERAFISIRLPIELKPEAASLTLIANENGAPSFRRLISHAEMQWQDAAPHRIGRCEVALPQPLLLTCRALYAGCLHDRCELLDTSNLPNMRRMLVELADPALKRLQGPLTAPKNHKEQDSFEAAVAALFYMLGFDAVRVGGVRKLEEAADIFATTPSGQILIVECTTELLDPRDKIGKLLARVSAARTQLSAARRDFKAAQLSGMIVIPKPRSELSLAFTTAEAHGLIVLARSDIEIALEATRHSFDADKVLSRWRKAAATGALPHPLNERI